MSRRPSARFLTGGGQRHGPTPVEASGATTRITDDGANEQAKQIGDRSKARVLY